MSTRQDQDIVLLLEKPSGYREAFDLIVSRYHQRIYHHVRRIVMDHEDAADVVQEVYIKIWKNLGRFRKDAAIFTWVYRIASNESLNFIKSRKRRRTFAETMSSPDSDNSLSYHQGLEGEEIMKRLLKAVHALPEKQQLVFHLRYFEEMPYEQIAQITGTSEGALKASYHFASKKIEEGLDAV